MHYEEQLPPIIPLNVGGHRFMTRLSTLQKDPDCMLAAMFSGRHKVDRDTDGYYFIDNDGKYFSYILNFLRFEKLPPDSISLEVYEEAKYYSLISLLNKLKLRPSIAKMLVVEAQKMQFPIEMFQNLKEQVIKKAIEEASRNKQDHATVLIYAFKQTFTPKSADFRMDHGCVADSAHVTVGPWEDVSMDETPTDESDLIKCLERDFVYDGFTLNSDKQKEFDMKSSCLYRTNTGVIELCGRAVFRITFQF